MCKQPSVQSQLPTAREVKVALPPNQRYPNAKQIVCMGQFGLLVHDWLSYISHLPGHWPVSTLNNLLVVSRLALTLTTCPQNRASPPIPHPQSVSFSSPLRGCPFPGTHAHHFKSPSESLQTINAGEGVEKREPSYTVGGNAN